jgi:hypothetical protein
MTCTDRTVNEPAHDVGGGRLVATVTDPAPALGVVAIPIKLMETR